MAAALIVRKDKIGSVPKGSIMAAFSQLQNALLKWQQSTKKLRRKSLWLGYYKPGGGIPVVGVSKVSQLDQLVAAVDIQLAEEDIAYLEELYRPVDNLLSIGSRNHRSLYRFEGR